MLSAPRAASQLERLRLWLEQLPAPPTQALEHEVDVPPLEFLLGACPEIHESINPEAMRSKTTGRCEGDLKYSGSKALGQWPLQKAGEGSGLLMGIVQH